MPKEYVPEGAWLACNRGTSPSMLRVSNNKGTKIYGFNMATEADSVPYINIKPMGICTLKGGICIPLLFLKWDDPQECVIIDDQRMLKEDSTCKCLLGGKIAIHQDKAAAEAACAFGGIKMPSEYIKKGFDRIEKGKAEEHKKWEENVPDWMKSGAHAAAWLDDVNRGLTEGAINGVLGLPETIYQVAQDPVGTAEAIGGMAVEGAKAYKHANYDAPINAAIWASKGDNWNNAYKATKDWVSNSKKWEGAANSAWENTKKAGAWVTEWVDKHPRDIGTAIGQFIPDAIAFALTDGASAALSAGGKRVIGKELIEGVGKEGIETIGKEGIEAIGKEEAKKIGKVIVEEGKDTVGKQGTKEGLEESAELNKRSLKGEPVDVATGEMLIDDTGFELPGIIPMLWKTIWFNTSTYEGSLGRGWSHSYDQSLTIDASAGKIMHRTADGRSLAYPFLAHDGASCYKRSEKATLYRQPGGYMLYRHAEQLQYVFKYSSAAEKHMLTGIYNADGAAITFEYAAGRLVRITDSCKRTLKLAYNDAGRLLEVALLPDNLMQPPEVLTGYEYNRQGLLAAITYPNNSARYFGYNGHAQIIRHQLRSGISFYFEYDGTGPAAKCVHTWGEGDVLNYRFSFEDGKTIAVNSLGAVTAYYHDGHLVTKTIDPDGHTWYSSYNEYNELIRQTDPLYNTTLYAYNTLGNLTTIFLPNRAQVAVTYNAQGLPISAVDADGGRWQWAYDEAGHLVKQLNPLQEVTAYRYENGLLAQLTDAAGHDTRFYYNSIGQLILVQAPNGQRTRWEYNHRGDCTATYYPNGTVQRLWYDGAGNIIKVEEPNGNVRHITYSPTGNPLEAKDSNTHLLFKYDHTGRLVSRRQNGQIIQYGYDTELNLTAVTNEQGSRYLFKLDGQGRIAAETGFDGLTRTYERNPAGQVVRVLRPGGRTTAYSYNRMGQVTAVQYGDGDGSGAKEAYTYTPGGRTLTAANEHDTVSFAYDAAGRLITECTGTGAISSYYDVLGQRTALTSTFGAHLQLERNVMGDVLQMTAGGWQAAIRRNADGLETGRQLPGDIQSVWEVDGTGRPTLHNVFNGRTFKATRQKRYSWAANNRLQELWDTLHNHKTFFAYNGAGRLTGARHTAGNGGHEVRSADAIGNLFEQHDHKDRRYGAGGRLLESRGTKYAYDEEGNLISKTLKSGEVWTYEWNAAGMLAKVTRPDKAQVTFGYDALGRRVWKKYRQTLTRYMWDGNKPLHEWKEFDAKEAMPDELITWIFEEGSFAPAAKIKGGKQYSIINNHLGTPVQGFNTEGTLIWERELDIYGRPRMIKGEEGFCNYLYQGQMLDHETGLAYNRFRYYAPEEGVYITQDPIGINGGLLLYGYVDDSNSQIDILGLQDGSGLTGKGSNGPWKFDPERDVDLRGGKGTYKDALDEAFRRTGFPKEEFYISEWGKNEIGKSVPVEWKHPSEAKVNMDIPKWNNVIDYDYKNKVDRLGNGPHQPHIGYEIPKGPNPKKVIGHIFTDDIPATRAIKKEAIKENLAKKKPVCPIP